MCPSLPGFACFVSIFPQLSENEMESCRKYEAYFGWIPKQGPITRYFCRQSRPAVSPREESARLAL